MTTLFTSCSGVKVQEQGPDKRCDPAVDGDYQRETVQRVGQPTHERLIDPRTRAIRSEQDVPAMPDATTAEHASASFIPAASTPVQPVGMISPQGATGPGCCSVSGSGILHVSVRYCTAFCLAEYTFNAQINYSWGGEIPGVQPSTVTASDTFQWLSGVTGQFFQDGGVVFGLPQYYYDFEGRGPNTGFLSDKAQIVRNCVLTIGCVTENRPAINMYVHNDGGWDYESWSY
ncbi:MAG: hypothetical protein ACR2G7_00700 [Acidimicrobiales bacterium]